ncbi:MAG: flagellin, partial [OM182 bacterium]|nr:flagellin [OM182 bacterium]
ANGATSFDFGIAAAAVADDTGTFTSTTINKDVTDLTLSAGLSQVKTQGSTAETAVSAISIHDAAGASAAIVTLDKAITGVTAEQAKYGAYLSRLQYASDNISNVATNLDQSRSRIQDADYAVETTALARTQIIAQASTAMLAQANQVKQTVLALLQ